MKLRVEILLHSDYSFINLTSCGFFKHYFTKETETVLDHTKISGDSATISGQPSAQSGFNQCAPSEPCEPRSAAFETEAKGEMPNSTSGDQILSLPLNHTSSKACVVTTATAPNSKDICVHSRVYPVDQVPKHCYASSTP